MHLPDRCCTMNLLYLLFARQTKAMRMSYVLIDSMCIAQSTPDCHSLDSMACHALGFKPAYEPQFLPAGIAFDI